MHSGHKNIRLRALVKSGRGGASKEDPVAGEQGGLNTSLDDLLLDPEKSVVFSHTFATGGRTSLDLAGSE